MPRIYHLVPFILPLPNYRCSYCICVRRAEASRRWLTQSSFEAGEFHRLFGVFFALLAGGGFAFFLGKREPGEVSAYEAFFIWLLFSYSVRSQILSVMNDKYRKEIVWVSAAYCSSSVFHRTCLTMRY